MLKIEDRIRADIRLAKADTPFQHLRRKFDQMVRDADKQAIAIVDKVLGEGWPARPDQRARCRNVFLLYGRIQVIEIDGEPVVRIIAPQLTMSTDEKHYYIAEAVVTDLRAAPCGN